MKERDYIAYLADMVEAMEKIARYLDTVDGLQGFLRNEMVIDAVTRNFEVIGEASKMIPATVKEKYPDVPWKQMYGLRNFAVHESTSSIRKFCGRLQRITSRKIEYN